MYAALFEMDSMFGRRKYIFQGETPVEIIDAFEYEQSMECLIHHGRYEEGRNGQLVLDRLEVFYNKYIDRSLTMDDIATLDVELSVGTIKCLATAEGAEAITTLKVQHPDCRS